MYKLKLRRCVRRQKGAKKEGIERDSGLSTKRMGGRADVVQADRDAKTLVRNIPHTSAAPSLAPSA